MVVSRLAQRLLVSRGSIARRATNVTNGSWRCSSTAPNGVDPSKFVAGVTVEDIENDPSLAAFFQANFPSYFGDAGMEEKDDGGASLLSSFTREELYEHGFTDEEIDFDSEMALKYGKTKSDPKDPRSKRIDYGLGSPEQQALNIRVMKTYKRTVEGSARSRGLRRNNLIPGLIHGVNPALNMKYFDPKTKIKIQTPWRELHRETARHGHAFQSRVYDLTVYENEDDDVGETHRVTPRSVQWHPYKIKLYCANFCRYMPGRPIKIPIVYINEDESPALKRDGFIVPINRFVECVVEDGVPIPENLELECTGIKLKDVIRLERIEFPDGVKISDNVDPKEFIVGPVFGGRGSTSSTEETEEKEE